MVGFYPVPNSGPSWYFSGHSICLSVNRKIHMEYPFVCFILFYFFGVFFSLLCFCLGCFVIFPVSYL